VTIGEIEDAKVNLMRIRSWPKPPPEWRGWMSALQKQDSLWHG